MFLPAVAAANGPRLVRFPTGTVRPGDVIELAWSRPAGEVRELEIVLSLDGGQRYTMRVSPELDRARDHFTWRVPAVASAHARLSVRYGEEREERLSQPTPEFAIAPAAPASGTAPDLRSAWVTNLGRAMDWWDEADSAPRAGDAPSLDGAPGFERGADNATTAITHRRRGSESPGLVTGVARIGGRVSDLSTTVDAVPVSTVPLFTPKRE